MRIKKGDNVLVIAGKERGKTGVVSRALPDDNTIIIEGLNTRKRHVKPRRAGQKGEIAEFSAPMHVSNIQLICHVCGKKTRIGYEIKGSEKRRVCKKCGA
ncbi:MAG: 50S ribosomal protein L24 [Candidatus Ryanbacteria bacterium CG10_big_fil_rev_8_21_14_0_10_43_42]|uniref:Large ribosomal subunit protein uL24 n=1 Tax=Candidatus Ryanbacteria bacterium CG10_big_fil_rev_8_21_14_0_10_43_42 TaxID=1974864 RepID=A0A2M8KY74_9BACT|nr:MAG: 50S ribosomal protein L24 [Candidatus Ryanbacteria bacterium CG10_big_fil_rev_8_21_14_0_10_43_42]